MVTEFSSRLSKGLQASPLGKGIYTLLEAARLSKVSSRRIRYWLGHIESEQAKEERKRVLWQGQHEPIDAKMALDFLDLQEVRFVEAFLKAGVSWRLLRLATVSLVIDMRPSIHSALGASLLTGNIL
jgi:hypothetical protein